MQYGVRQIFCCARETRLCIENELCINENLLRSVVVTIVLLAVTVVVVVVVNVVVLVSLVVVDGVTGDVDDNEEMGIDVVESSVFFPFSRP